MNHSSDSCTVSLLRGVARATLVLWALLTFLPSAPARASDAPSPVIEENEPPVNVLLLFASPRLTPAQIALDEAFRSTLTTRLSSPIYFYTEYLDLTLFEGDEPRPELQALLKQKYRPVKLDLVVAFTSRALRFAVQNRAGLFPGAPVVFASVDPAALANLEPARDRAGTWLNVDWPGPLAAALRLQPDTNRVVLIPGTASNDRVLQDAARRQLGDRYGSRVSIEYLSNLSADEVVKRVAALSKGTIVLFGPFSR